MLEIQVRDAKAFLSKVIDNARQGAPSIIIRHGRREAVVLSFEEWERPSRVPSFGRRTHQGQTGAGTGVLEQRAPVSVSHHRRGNRGRDHKAQREGASR